MVLALGVLLDLRKPRLQLRLALLRAGFLAVERVALHLDAVQHGRAGCLLLAERLQLVGDFGLRARDGGLRLRQLADERVASSSALPRSAPAALAVDQCR